MPISHWSFEQQVRQIRGYELLVRTEEHIRRFINVAFTQQYGAAWLRGVPAKLKEEVARRRGAFPPGLSISDFLSEVNFGDYKKILRPRGSRQNPFSSRLKDTKTVGARLTSINKYRCQLAHSRPLSEAELTSLEAESKELFRELRVRKPRPPPK